MDATSASDPNDRARSGTNRRFDDQTARILPPLPPSHGMLISNMTAWHFDPKKGRNSPTGPLIPVRSATPRHRGPASRVSAPAGSVLSSGPYQMTDIKVVVQSTLIPIFPLSGG
ncbi:hypothetical protein CCHR01_17125 [Colletotrichum chrysophilum]|uniref:Uncharacterized protein n=1 Tax=Colletotrichum chrysophilum TaxID=1836956 RepID=A0AAD9A374_9PEZI|nr:hypothetical protein CCHR01_17125 [Colletotrichum chrysophilum]